MPEKLEKCVDEIKGNHSKSSKYAICNSSINKSEGLLELIEPKKVIDPRGDGAVLDNQGQPNIIDYSNQEPLLFGLGQNSSHEYPGKIVINNESRYVDREVKRSFIPNVAETGKYSVGADRTQPTLPTGAPYELIQPDHNMHGLNFNDKINWNETKEVVSIPGTLVDREVAGKELELKEAGFKEEEHPREPAGSIEGGQFVSPDKLPTGTSKEDKDARETFYKDTNQDNMNLEKLTSDITLKTIDRNIASVEKDDTKASSFNDDLALMKIKKDRLVDALKDKKRLEGVQAQRALINIEKETEAAGKAKEGTKKWETHMMNKQAYTMRLDMIRRGTIADFDLTGKPTNQAAFEQQQEKKQVEKAMAKKPVKTTQSDLTGFKDISNIKLGNNVDKTHVKKIEKLWNGLDAEDRKLVDNMMIRSSRKSGSTTAGEWRPETKTMEFTTHPLFTEKDYEETIHHEIAHVKFRRMPEEKRNQWNEAVKDIQPPTNYTQFHDKRYNDYRFRNFRVTPADKPIVERNLKALKNMYYEEIHSEIYANQKSPLGSKKIWSKKGLDEATKIYKEMFG